MDLKEKELSRIKEAKKQARADVAREQLRLLECKICRDTPTPPVVLVTCCKQVLGCERCFSDFTEKQKYCPLCHDAGGTTIPICGLDEPFALLRQEIQS